MKDPSSYDHVKTVYFDRGSYLLVTTTYRGKNSFGALVLETTTAKVNLNGDILEIVQ